MSTADLSTSIINEVFGPDAPSAQRIAMCESTLNPNAVNSTPIGGSHAEGLFQILIQVLGVQRHKLGHLPLMPGRMLLLHTKFL